MTTASRDGDAGDKYVAAADGEILREHGGVEIVAVLRIDADDLANSHFPEVCIQDGQPVTAPGDSSVDEEIVVVLDGEGRGVHRGGRTIEGDVFAVAPCARKNVAGSRHARRRRAIANALVREKVDVQHVLAVAAGGSSQLSIGRQRLL